MKGPEKKGKGMRMVKYVALIIVAKLKQWGVG